ncbi:MAG TPA: hypothetical protein DEP82_14780 [Arthrobacter bacterium]|jgi:hypothetical protein|nr:hypothetical protein [Arthrobacter sp.]HCB59137.1 hypothetical protein [Arthrobacter sp.]
MYRIPEAEWQDNLDHEGRWDPQCIVITKRGTRCLHRIFAGQVYDNVDGFHYINNKNAEKFQAGICPFHLHLLEAK